MPNIAWGKIEQKHRGLHPFWEKLMQKGHHLLFLHKEHSRLSPAPAQGRLFYPKNSTKLSKFLSRLCFFPVLALNLTALFHYKRQHKLEAVVAFSHQQLKILKLPARILKLQLIFLLLPGENLAAAQKADSKKIVPIKTACFCDSDRLRLEKAGFDPARISLLPLGVPAKGLKLQGNLFSELAEQDQKKSLKKFFSVLTIADLNNPAGLELLFTAAQKVLTVFNNLQLVIIGDGPERQKMKWLADKKGLGNIVWFVGEQEYLQKWFKPADLYLNCSPELKFDDCWHCLKAAAAGLPLILPGHPQFEDLFIDQDSAYFYSLNDSESLTQALITLKQKQSLRLRLSKNAKLRVDSEHKLGKMVKNFEEIFLNVN